MPEGTPGAIRITGTIYDGRGEVIPDHLIEFWQPDQAMAASTTSTGTASSQRSRASAASAATASRTATAPMRCSPSSPAGCRGPNNGTPQAPHIDVTLFARGMLNRVVTRLYFADETEANATDPVLATVPAERRNTLLAQPTADGYRFDIHLQGPGETVFFDI